MALFGSRTRALMVCPRLSKWGTIARPLLPVPPVKKILSGVVVFCSSAESDDIRVIIIWSFVGLKIKIAFRGKPSFCKKLAKIENRVITITNKKAASLSPPFFLSFLFFQSVNKKNNNNNNFIKIASSLFYTLRYNIYIDD